MPTNDDAPAGYDVLTHFAAEAADAVDAQVQKLQSVSQVVEAPRLQAGVTKEAAILAALVARQQTADQNIANKAALDRLDTLGEQLTGMSKALTESVDRFTTATDASTKQLTKWTKVMAWATIVLSVFAFAQVVVAVLTWLRPHF